MSANKAHSPEKKSGLHEQNRHRNGYDFDKLIGHHSELKDYVIINKFDKRTIDFFNPKAVKALNTALLKTHYNIKEWDIPAGYLCPPIPGRADYIHHMAGLIKRSTSSSPRNQKITCLDIGTGANCIYPIIGVCEYGWSFIGSDADETALKSAGNIILNNPSLKEKVELRHQTQSKHIFHNIISEGEEIDLTISNPPFHSSAEAAQKATIRKLKNLKGKNIKKPILNFGGQNTELWCKGGEERFIKTMILESMQFAFSAFWFSTLISNEKVLKLARRALKEVHPKEVKTIDMSQGNKKSRILAWTYLSRKDQKEWVERKWT